MEEQPQRAQPQQQGFQSGGRNGDLFAGAAAYYAAYRRPYPRPVVDHLIARCGLDGTGRLLDVGCGTGQVFQVLARCFREVLAIDPDVAMATRARETALRHGLHNVVVEVMRAEDLSPDQATLRAAVCGASFHWMDRILVANVLHEMLEPRGFFAALSTAGIHGGSTQWEAAIRGVLVRHLGPDRRAGGGTYVRGEDHHDALARTRFRRVERAIIRVKEAWSVEELVGYLYSTSYSSKQVLGERSAAFEDDVRRSLLRLSAGGTFERVVEYSITLAMRG